jgi:hypothetical protein
MVHKGALVDVILGVEYQHFDVNGARAFCVHPGCAPPAVRDFDLSAAGDLVRARMTIKTQGYLLAAGVSERRHTRACDPSSVTDL